jgi:molecular chaperone HscB
LKRAESGSDPFSLLGLPRSFALDPAELDRRHHELARRFHPDRFARAAPADRRDALTRATALNDAHRTLRDPRRRAELLLRLCGVDVPAEERSLSDPDFLEAQLELREQLAAARAQGDAATVACIAVAARARLASVDVDLSRLLVDDAPDPRARREAVALLLRARFDEGLAAAAAPR